MSYEPTDKKLVSKFPVFEAPRNLTYPDSLDWRTKGAVGSIKDQVRLVAMEIAASLIAELLIK